MNSLCCSSILDSSKSFLPSRAVGPALCFNHFKVSTNTKTSVCLKSLLIHPEATFIAEWRFQTGCRTGRPSRVSHCLVFSFYSLGFHISLSHGTSLSNRNRKKKREINSRRWCRRRKNPCRWFGPACWCANWPSCFRHRRRYMPDFVCSRLLHDRTRASRL